jgi:NADH dehydrogenase (ubiquinone) 1 alpha/beta subcomplex 1
MKREEGEYFADPVNVGERVVRLLALHDNIKDPESITLNQSFEEIGLNQLDMVEVFLAVEREFDLEIGEDECESMTTVNDLVEYLAKSFYTK